MKPIIADEPAIEKAVAFLKLGRLVAFPTETVYGLGADASNPEAVNKIFAAKGRPADHPLIVHIENVEQLEKWALAVPDAAWLLASRFWPGPLAMILPKRPEVSTVVTGGQATVGLRIPNHPVALKLLKRFGGGIAAPSANRFCRISPTRAEHVEQELGDAVDLILDGGPCCVGVESTIIDLSGEAPRLLRPGHITVNEIASVLRTEVKAAAEAMPSGVRAPGMLDIHYAPTTLTILCSTARIVETEDILLSQQQRIGILSHQRLIGNGACYLRPMPDDAESYAQSLYAALRELDGMQLDRILVEQPPEDPAWAAVNDRLRKAATMLLV